MDFLTDSVAEIAARVNSGQQSAREVTAHAIARIEALNPTLNAFVAWDGEQALGPGRRHRRQDRRRSTGRAVGRGAGRGEGS
jgi:Asp-tRNA(Asn)/Glu-tRNA(Gln) amidotransferase A subunit family amidase